MIVTATSSHLSTRQESAGERPGGHGEVGHERVVVLLDEVLGLLASHRAWGRFPARLG
jgi:hypothetical protein